MKQEKYKLVLFYEKKSNEQRNIHNFLAWTAKSTYQHLPFFRGNNEGFYKYLQMIDRWQ